MPTIRGPHIDEETREMPLPAVLVVTTPGPLHGQRLSFERQRSSVGRAPESDVVLDDPHVSRRHAVIGREGDGIWVDDAGSRSGTFVNDAPVSGPTELAVGDRVRFGAVELELLAPVSGGARPPDPRRAQRHAGRFDIQSQYANSISNVGRDQYVYNQLALRIAPMRRRARRLLWMGWVLIFTGLAFGVVMIAAYQREIWNCISNSSAQYGCEIDFTGLALFPIGMLLTLAGLAMAVAAFLMRRRADREERAL